MKKSLKLVLLILVLALLTGALFAVKHFFSGEETDNPGPETTAASFEKDKVDVFTVTSSGQSLTFKRTGEKYVLTGGTGEAGDTQALNDSASVLLSELSSLKAERTVCERSDNLSDYGLDKPTFSVTLSFSDGTEKKYLFGNTAVTGGCYFKAGFSDTVYLIGSSITDDVMNIFTPQEEDTQ